MNAVAPVAQHDGWAASLSLGYAPRNEKSVLLHRRQRGPLAVQRPFYPEGDLCHQYILHPPGGVVGGDRLAISVSVERGAGALLTTPGATKFYRSAGPLAEQVQRLRVADGGTLEWLPQENILFPGAALQLSSEIDLAGDARCIGWEIHCLGRPVIGERFDSGQADLQLALRRDGQPLLLDRFQITPDRLDGPAGLRGRPLLASLFATPADEAALQAVRALLPSTGQLLAGATLLDDLLVLRAIGDSSEQIRKLFIDAWQALRPSVIGRAPCPPRIWST